MFYYLVDIQSVVWVRVCITPPPISIVFFKGFIFKSTNWGSGKTKTPNIKLYNILQSQLHIAYNEFHNITLTIHSIHQLFILTVIHSHHSYMYHNIHSFATTLIDSFIHRNIHLFFKTFIHVLIFHNIHSVVIVSIHPA